MENSIGLGNLQKTLTDNIRQLTDLSVSAMKPLIASVSDSMTAYTKVLPTLALPNLTLPNIKLQSSDCCRPVNECPPHCLTSITRYAMQGERIIVPFSVKNTCAVAKTYRIGVRELIDCDGNLAPEQPGLNKQSITLQPGRSEKIQMTIDLGKFENGKTYTTEIVLREDKINQNICFTLCMDDCANLVTAEPQSEKKYNLRWQGWESHFYCEKPAGDGN
jgi:hypothetical protein